MEATTVTLQCSNSRSGPDPNPNQPGNGVVYYIDRDTKKAVKHTYKCLNDLLEKHYGEDTHHFAQDIKKVFENNSAIFNVPPVTAEIYMVLLFEIGRWLISAKKSSLDKLQIGIAVARLVKLLEAKKCSFKDVFLKGKQLHCFSGSSTQRETAINEINAAYESFANAESLNEDVINSELRQMFCRE